MGYAAGARDSGIGQPPEHDAIVAAARQPGPEVPEDASDSDTEPDADAAPKGAGARGRGPPLKVGSGARERHICDGAGLCSPGRWPPRERPRAGSPRLRLLGAAVRRAVSRLDGDGGNWCRDLFGRLCRGDVTEIPFPKRAVDDLVEYAHSLYQDPAPSSLPRDGDLPQPVRVRLLQAILKSAEDPDWRGMDLLAQGIRLGVGCRLPRTPAVFERKRRWRIPGQEDPEGWRDDTVESVWRDNYQSATDQSAELERQLQECYDVGWALRMTAEEASATYPNLVVSSLGAVVKLDPATGEQLSVRMILDGTHGVGLNNRIRVRDQDRCPAAADIRRYQRAQCSYSPGLGLAADVKGAHRLPAVAPQDWPLQGCRASSGGDVYLFKVGVFGISSIAYWWARLGGAVIRALHAVTDLEDELWVLMMADDIKLESTANSPERAIITALLFFSVLGVPMSWGKTQGGTTIKWIGYELMLREFQLGITAERAAWAVGWLRRVVRDRRVLMEDLRSALGKLSFVCGVLEYERPFLAPAFAYLALHRDHSVCTLPLYLSCVFDHIAERITRRRMYPSACTRLPTDLSPRVDAKAEGGTVSVGGWLPRRGADGSIDKSSAPWFAATLTQQNAPWAFCREGEAYRTIAALEAMATLLSTVIFSPLLPINAAAQVVLTSVTDNRGNSFALTKLMTTRFPLCLIVMELSAQLEARNMRLEMQWSPRDLNSEADALTNGDYTGFNPEHRIAVDLGAIPWLVLNRLMAHALDFEESRQRAKRRRALKNA